MPEQEVELNQIQTEQEICLENEPIRIGGGGGAVNSVNGKTGDVVITAEDLGAATVTELGTAVNGLSESIGTVAGNLATETSNRSNADTTLQGNINTETTARQNADSGLQQQIDALAASSDVTDIVGTYADLEAYDTSKLNDNDIIKVLQDETHDDETTYYRWSTSTETFTLIGEEGPYYTKSAADNKFQDKLTAGSNVSIDADNVISATDTTYSAFTGTDGTNPGTSGLVPAPAAADLGKFLNADGTWSEAATKAMVISYATLNGNAAPTTSTAGQTVGQLYYDTTNDAMYYLSAITPQGTTPETYTYTWNTLGGGSSVTLYSDFGENTDGAMTQKAVTDGIFSIYNSRAINIGGNRNNAATASVALGRSASASTTSGVAIGDFARATSTQGVAIGNSAYANKQYCICIGVDTKVTQAESISLGHNSQSTRTYELSVGSGAASNGTRFVANVTDPSLPQDAATKNYVDTAIIAGGTTAPTTTTAGSVGTLYAYVSSGTGHLAICTAIDTTDPNNPVYTWATLI